MISEDVTITLESFINKGLEFLWLLTVVLVPLTFFSPDTVPLMQQIGEVELPKIVLLRTLVGLMAILWLVQWALQSRVPFGVLPRGERYRPTRWLAALGGWLLSQPTRWLVVSVVLYLAFTLLSTALSASFNASVFGHLPGGDSYGTYTVIAYVVLFGVVATRLKSRPQLWRLLGAIVFMGVLVAAYAVLQRYGYDFWGLQGFPPGTQTNSTLGNPIFAASVLLMSLIISLALATVTLMDRWGRARFWGKVAFWSLVLTVQLLGTSFTLSRGPWVGTTVALVAFLGLVAVVVGWRTLVRAALVFVVAMALTSTILSWSPQSLEGPSSATNVTERFASIGGDVIGGTSSSSSALTGRIDIWQDSWQLILHRPWFGFDNLSLPSPAAPDWIWSGPVSICLSAGKSSYWIGAPSCRKSPSAQLFNTSVGRARDSGAARLSWRVNSSCFSRKLPTSQGRAAIFSHS